jgi:hypothetical protein
MKSVRSCLFTQDDLIFYNRLHFYRLSNGAVVGGVVYHQTGAAGLAIAGGAYFVGLAAFVGTGTVAGLAVFGVKTSVFG